jgi:hypothetical protein
MYMDVKVRLNHKGVDPSLRGPLYCLSSVVPLQL